MNIRNEDEHFITDANIVRMLYEADLVAMGRCDGGPLDYQEKKDLIKALGVDPEAFFERVEKERKG